MKQFNANQQSIIDAFAKANKIGKAKIEKFASMFADTIAPRSFGGGRPVLPSTIERRNNVMQCLQKSDKPLTAKQIAEALHIDQPAEVHNALKYWQEATRVQIVGQAEKPANKRGKAPALFAVKL